MNSEDPKEGDNDDKEKEQFDLHELAEQTNSTPEEILEAIEAAGSRKEDIADYLNKHKKQ